MIGDALRGFIKAVVGAAFSLVAIEGLRFYYSAFQHQEVPVFLYATVGIAAFFVGLGLMFLYDATRKVKT